VIFVQNRELVIPGQKIAEGDYRLKEGVYREGDEIFAAVLGLAEISDNSVKVIPLEGRYIPKEGDTVVGLVVDVHAWGWVVDLNSPYTGNLLVSDYLQRKIDPGRENPHRHLTIGDVVALRVKEVNERKYVLLEKPPGLGKLEGGRMVEISPMKIPRVRGKKGSMLKVLQEAGGCRLFVGQNGRIVIWAKSPERTAVIVEALRKIERESHIPGLTDRIRFMLEGGSVKDAETGKADS